MLNGTLKVHFSKLLDQQRYEHFISEKLLRDLYVDYLPSSLNEDKKAFRFYETPKDIFSMGGFELRKWYKNCESLQVAKFYK